MSHLRIPWLMALHKDGTWNGASSDCCTISCKYRRFFWFNICFFLSDAVVKHLSTVRSVFFCMFGDWFQWCCNTKAELFPSWLFSNLYFMASIIIKMPERVYSILWGTTGSLTQDLGSFHLLEGCRIWLYLAGSTWIQETQAEKWYGVNKRWVLIHLMVFARLCCFYACRGEESKDNIRNGLQWVKDSRVSEWCLWYQCTSWTFLFIACMCHGFGSRRAIWSQACS